MLLSWRLKSSLFLIAVYFQSTLAWLPGDHKEIYNKEGINLFKRDHSIEARWLPTNNHNSRNKIRGVNLGSLFVFEPWMGQAYWNNTLGCIGTLSEFDCVSKLGQSKANTAFLTHWQTWITKSDFDKMASYGINTVRIPIGYWMYQDIVSSSEHFPQGGFAQLMRVCYLATSYGFYIILDLHGAPWSQSQTANPDTGQYTAPGFYGNSDAYNRTTVFLQWITQQVINHNKNETANVGMLEILNEPAQNSTIIKDMLSNFYPTAVTAIRKVQTNAGITGTAQLHIQVMNQQWGGYNPVQYISDTSQMAYDDHRYLKWAGVPDQQSSYISTSCNDQRGTYGPVPTIVTEWSLSTNNNEWDPATNKAFYQNWAAAQIKNYETQIGWCFWSWKTVGLNDPRWDYQLAVSAGLIPQNIDAVYNNTVCS